MCEPSRAVKSGFWCAQSCDPRSLSVWTRLSGESAAALRAAELTGFNLWRTFYVAARNSVG